MTAIERLIEEKTGLGGRLSQENLQKWQMIQLKNILEYVCTNSKFYREKLKAVNIESINQYEDLSHIPFTNADELLSCGNEFICIPKSQIARIVTLFTSGSQNISKRLFFTEKDLKATVDFFTYGIQPIVRGCQSVLIMMDGATTYSVGDLLQKSLNNISVKSKIYGQIKDIQNAVKAAEGYDCLIGVPSQIINLARTKNKLKPKTVLLSADYVSDSVVKAIEDIWQCKVFTHYGMTETGFGGGVQCSERKGYHMRDFDLITEIVDPVTGHRVPIGQYGEVVLTTLFREAMPLIRYKTGDISRQITEPCPCGGKLYTLDKIKGRIANDICISDKRSISIQKLDEIIYALPHVKGYTAKLQNSAGEELLTVCIDSENNEDENYIADYIIKCLGYTINVVVEQQTLSIYTGTAKRNIEIVN